MVKPQKFADCAKIFTDCKDAERYNNVEQEGNYSKEANDNEEQTTVNMEQTTSSELIN